MLAGCIANTTTAIKRASESTSEHAYIMNRNRFSERLWEGTIQELIGIDNILLTSLPSSKIVVYHDNVVVTTPHGQMTVNHTNPESQPDIQLAVIQTKGENDNPNGTWVFRYAMHSKDTTKASTEGNCPWLAPKMCWCATIETKVHRCKAYIMLDTGSTGNFMSPAFAKVTGMNTFPLEQQLTLQLGCIISWSKITHSGNGHIKIGNKVSEIYFDIANIDHYDCILGMPFCREHKAVLNFADWWIHLSEEIVPDQWHSAHIPRQNYWLLSPVRPKGPHEGPKGKGGVKLTPKKMSKSSEQQLTAIKTKEKNVCGIRDILS